MQTRWKGKLGLFTLISFHTQVLIGLYLYFTSAKDHFSGRVYEGEHVMRFFAIEHIFGMLVAVAIYHNRLFKS